MNSWKDKDRAEVHIHLHLYGAQAELLLKLKEEGMNMTAFVRKAVLYYVPFYIEKMKVLVRYEKAIKDQLRYSGEDV